MPPPKKSSVKRNIEIEIPCISSGEEVKQEHNTVKTAYINEDGQHHYKPSSDQVELEVSFDDQVLGTDSQGVVDDDTIAMVETQNSNVNYFMIMPEGNIAGHADNVTSEILHITNDDDTTSHAVTMFDMEENERRPEDMVDSEDDPCWDGSVQDFTCEICNYGTDKKYLLTRHMGSHSDFRPFICKVCERRFKTATSLANHGNTHTGKKPHTCTTCKSTFTTSGELVRHVRYKHSGDRPHKCSDCDYASVEMSKLRRHMRCHTGERPYQCTHCTFAFTDNFKLKRHMRTHTGERPYKCTKCKLTFTQSNSLKTHMNIHASKKPVFACELCSATCGRKADLRIHMEKQHNTAKPITCKKCSKTFPDNHTYKIHLKTHEGEMHSCMYCSYRSTNIRAMNSHILKHADKKPFACDKCDQTFRQKQLLRRHQNVSHNPDYVPAKPKEKAHVCHVCYRSYAHKANYLRHLASHLDGHETTDGKTDKPMKRKYRRKDAHSDSETEDESRNDQSDSDDDTLMKISLDVNAKLKKMKHESDGQAALDNKKATASAASIKKKTYNYFGFDEGEGGQEICENSKNSRICATKNKKKRASNT